MNSVTSRGGTSIAYERQGRGVAEGSSTARNAPLAAVLAGRFTTYNDDRRGRGESGDTPPYSLEREIEDIEALLAEAGGSAHLYGISSSRQSRRRPWLPREARARRERARWIQALDAAADAIAESVSGAERLRLAGQSHVVDPTAMTAVLEVFFASDSA